MTRTGEGPPPSDAQGRESATVVVRAYGNPLPLGFFAFGIGMALLAGIALDLISGEQVRSAGLLLAVFVSPLEFLAAVMAFLTRDTGAAAALGLFATSWAGLGVLYIVAPAQRTSVAVGMYLCAFALMLVPLAVVGFLGKSLLGIVLTVSILRASLSAAYQLGAPRALQLANGAAAFLLVALAVYAGAAFLVEDVRQHTVLPVLRRGEARRAIEDDHPKEPGTHRQL